MTIRGQKGGRYDRDEEVCIGSTRRQVLSEEGWHKEEDREEEDHEEEDHEEIAVLIEGGT